MYKIIPSILLFCLALSLHSFAFDFDDLANKGGSGSKSITAKGDRDKARESKSSNSQWVNERYSDYRSPPPRSRNSSYDGRSCYTVLNQCLNQCRGLNKNDGSLVIISSTKDACEGYCHSAKLSCDQGDIAKQHEYVCLARCYSFRDDNSGVFSSSDRNNCKMNCY